MSLPGLGSIPNISGGPANATSGDASGKSGDVGGITSPIVIGGYKSNGSASVGTVPQWVIYAGVAVLIGGALYLLLRR